MTIYVDDGTIGGPGEQEVGSELDTILEKFPGRRIKPQVVSGENGSGPWCAWDVLGSDVYYRRSTKEVKFSMSSFIRKLAIKYHLEDSKETMSPYFEESALYQPNSPSSDFPVRECVGSLMWVASERPDVQVAAQILARAVNSPHTRSVANCCKKVVRYLWTTREKGI